MRRGAAPLLFGLLLAGGALAAPEFQGRLTGIVIAASLREAIFVENGTTHRLQPGEVIDGWTVASVEPNAVTLTADGETTRLSPARSLAAEAPPPPVAPRMHQVSDALLRQQREQAEAEATMAAATAKMEAEKAAHRTGAAH
jgi:hypothetical protein